MPAKAIKYLVILSLVILGGCISVPDNVTPVKNFEPDRYLGKWYEIARFDHSFERGLIKVSAAYSSRDDGGIKVVNRGFDPVKNKWKEAVGKAYFVDKKDIGRLKVSFFGPFYGAYNIIELDQKDYRYSVVCGPDKSYLWILARKPDLDKNILSRLVDNLKQFGFDTEKLIYVEH